jgi:hypothetical protein
LFSSQERNIRELWKCWLFFIVPPPTSDKKHGIVKPLFIVFVGCLKKKQCIRANNRCGSHGWNRIRSGTIEIERRIRER